MAAACATATITGAVVVMADVAVTISGAAAKAMGPTRFLLLTPKLCSALPEAANAVKAMVGRTGAVVKARMRYLRRSRPSQAYARAVVVSGCAVAAKAVDIVSLRPQVALRSGGNSAPTGQHHAPVPKARGSRLRVNG